MKSIGKKVKVYSNGLLPGVIEELCHIPIDYFSIDVKYINAKDSDFGYKGDKPYYEKVSSSLDIIKKLGVPLEVRTTKFLNSDFEEVISYMKSSYPDVPHIIQNLSKPAPPAGIPLL